ncbi:MAG: response regulator transcription factor [Thermodesulfobacteriota bacterium]
MNALIVDDNPVFRDVLRSILCTWLPGLQICEAGSVAEGYARFVEQGPGVVFVDIGLPDGSGLELVKRIKQEAPGTTVAVCSNHEEPAYREAAHACGADCFLGKSTLDGSRVAAVVRRAQEARAAGSGSPRAADVTPEARPTEPWKP